MLEKICGVIFSEKRQKKIFRITKIAYFCGVILLICLPLISKHIKIEEKHLRNTSLFAKKIGNDNFASYASTYFNNPDPNDKIFDFCQQIFVNSSDKPYNYVFSKDIISPRGRKLHLIQINLIYDQFLRNYEIMQKSNFIFYALMKFLSQQDNNTWLSKDIQFNYITKELFYNKPKECYEILTNGKFNKKIGDGKIISAIYNFDLSEFDVEHMYTILIKGIGVNSELVDIDFYRMVVANLQATFKDNEFYVTTNDPVLSEKNKRIIINILNKLADIINNFLPRQYYTMKYMYLIENVLNNFFMINNKINTNHLLVTNGYNSLLIKTLDKRETNSQNRETIFTKYYKLIGTTLLMIKGMTNEEVDLFRGLYFYLLTSPFHCINYNYLFLLIFMCLRGFFNLIDLIYHNEFKYIWTIDYKDIKKLKEENNENNIDNDFDNDKNVIYASRILATLFFSGIFYVLFIINIESFMKVANIKNVENAYYYMIFIIFISQLFILHILKLSKSEEKFIDIIIMYIIILNCWNFVFINIGIGMVMSAILLSYEFIFLHLKQVKNNPIKIGLIAFVLFVTLAWKEFIRSMMINYFNYKNNIYTIITMTLVILTLRLALFIIMMTNKMRRKEPWDYDEIIDIGEIEEDNEDKDDKKKEEKKDDYIEDSDKENDENDDKNVDNENDNNKEDKIMQEKDKNENK
jgi:hypothetical protein